MLRHRNVRGDVEVVAECIFIVVDDDYEEPNKYSKSKQIHQRQREDGCWKSFSLILTLIAGETWEIIVLTTTTFSIQP